MIGDESEVDHPPLEKIGNSGGRHGSEDPRRPRLGMKRFWSRPLYNLRQLLGTIDGSDGTFPKPPAFEPSIDITLRFFERAHSLRPRRVLEAGTLQALPGRSTHLRARFPEISDEDYVRMDIAGGPDVDVVADLHAMPAEWSNRFDAFIANAVFEHLERPWLAAKEVFRVLAPGGLFMVATHQTFPLHGYPRDFFRFSREALRLIFEDAGFIVEASEYSDRCLIVPPESILLPKLVRTWNAQFPSYILVMAVGHKPD
jgi:SAM-dependent methyltransferase